MAFGLPVLAFNVAETVVTAGPAAEYVAEPSASAYADTLAALLDHPKRRARMAAVGVRRAREQLDWRMQRPAYLEVYARLIGRAGPASLPVGRPTAVPEPVPLRRVVS
jgi:glycosyltransferase involved in cell wall biosynthesis